jgi:hypothetical protein
VTKQARTPKKPNEKVLKCQDCDRPGEHRGWFFEARKGRLDVLRNKKARAVRARSAEDFMDGMFKKIYRPMCGEHYLQHMFQLFPYRCTARCVRERLRSNRFKLKPTEMLVYFPLTAFLGGGPPKCGWCGKLMRPASKQPKFREAHITVPFGDDEDGEPPRSAR